MGPTNASSVAGSFIQHEQYFKTYKSSQPKRSIEQQIPSFQAPPHTQKKTVIIHTVINIEHQHKFPTTSNVSYHLTPSALPIFIQKNMATKALALTEIGWSLGPTALPPTNKSPNSPRHHTPTWTKASWRFLRPMKCVFFWMRNPLFREGNMQFQKHIYILKGLCSFQSLFYHQDAYIFSRGSRTELSSATFTGRREKHPDE